MHKSVKIVLYFCCISILAACTGPEPQSVKTSYIIKNNSSYLVKLKWRKYTTVQAVSISYYDSLEIPIGQTHNIFYEEVKQAPFFNADSLIISFDNTKSTHYKYIDLVPGNILREENYNKTVLNEFDCEYTYTITDLDYNYGN